MKNLLYISIITLFLQSCGPMIGTLGMVSLGAASKEKGLGTTISDNIINATNMTYNKKKLLWH